MSALQRWICSHFHDHLWSTTVVVISFDTFILLDGSPNATWVTFSLPGFHPFLDNYHPWVRLLQACVPNSCFAPLKVRQMPPTLFSENTTWPFQRTSYSHELYWPCLRYMNNSYLKTIRRKKYMILIYFYYFNTYLFAFHQFILHIEAKMHNISILDDVIFAFNMH